MVVDDLRPLYLPNLTYLPIGSSSVCCGVDKSRNRDTYLPIGSSSVCYGGDKNKNRNTRVIEMKRRYI